MADYSVHTSRVAKKFEWFGLTVVKRYLTKGKDSRDLRDVHSNPEFYDKGIDFVVNLPNAQKKTIDLKVDSYYGSDPSRKIRGLCNPDSGFILLETISQLHMIGPDGFRQMAPYPLDKEQMSLAGSSQALPMRYTTTSSPCSTMKPS